MVCNFTESEGLRIKTQNSLVHEGMQRLIEGPRKNRILGTDVRLEHHLDDSGRPWMTICDAHNCCVAHSSKKNARSFLAVPWEWCEECGNAYDEKMKALHVG